MLLLDNGVKISVAEFLAGVQEGTYELSDRLHDLVAFFCNSFKISAEELYAILRGSIDEFGEGLQGSVSSMSEGIQDEFSNNV